ncbi:MAG: DUF4321 domain-containing protein [Lachnospiraceae bacterium]|nr:DUF4321 domain-containing protein [Lachnospiraceae bacterium]
MALNKNGWSLFLLLLAGIVVGGFLGYLAQNVSWLSWLNYGQTFGLTTPVELNIGVMIITFGLTINFNIASILGIVIAIFVYRKL